MKKFLTYYLTWIKTKFRIIEKVNGICQDFAENGRVGYDVVKYGRI